jgi:hypothetical protein
MLRVAFAISAIRRVTFVEPLPERLSPRFGVQFCYNPGC